MDTRNQFVDVKPNVRFAKDVIRRFSILRTSNQGRPLRILVQKWKRAPVHQLVHYSYMGAGNDTCIFAILPVTAYLKNGCTAIHTYAFLDNGSNVSFCSDSLMNQLGASGKKMRLN